MQHMQASENTAYLILSLMLFVLRIYFEDVQSCLTIQRAVQIIVVTPESGKNTSHVSIQWLASNQCSAPQRAVRSTPQNGPAEEQHTVIDCHTAASYEKKPPSLTYVSRSVQVISQGQTWWAQHLLTDM